MSLINVFMTPSRVLIGVDTEGYDAINGKFIGMNKIFHMADSNLVLVGRGEQSFSLVLFVMLSQIYGTRDFDAMAEIIPEKFKEAYAALNANRHRPDHVNTCTFEHQQIVLAGWSKQLGRMRCCVFTQLDPLTAIDVVEAEDPGYIIPWEEAWGDHPDGEDSHAMIALINEQIRRTKDSNPNIAIGGDIVLVHLARDNMSCRVVANLP